MISPATAKILFLIALSFAPRDSSVILATSTTENYSWVHTDSGWSLRTKGLPSGVWFSKGEQPAVDEREMQSLERLHERQDCFVNVGDSGWAKKQNGAVFYIVDPGAPNEHVFTILYPTK
jgi:hypothetical protein